MENLNSHRANCSLPYIKTSSSSQEESHSNPVTKKELNALNNVKISSGNAEIYVSVEENHSPSAEEIDIPTSIEEKHILTEKEINSSSEPIYRAPTRREGPLEIHLPVKKSEQKAILDPENPNFYKQFSKHFPSSTREEALETLSSWEPHQLAVLRFVTGNCSEFNNLVLTSIRAVLGTDLSTENSLGKDQVSRHITGEISKIQHELHLFKTNKVMTMSVSDVPGRVKLLNDLKQIQNAVITHQLTFLVSISNTEYSNEHTDSVLSSIFAMFSSADPAQKAKIFIQLIDFINKIENECAANLKGKIQTVALSIMGFGHKCAADLEGQIKTRANQSGKEKVLSALLDQIDSYNDRKTFTHLEFSELNMNWLNLNVLAKKGKMLDLSHSNFNKAVLKITDFTSVILIKTTFVKAQMKSAVLDKADLCDADLTMADLDNVNFDQTIMNDGTIIKDVANWDPEKQGSSIIFKKNNNCVIQ